MTLRIVAGPKIDKTSKASAEQQFLAHPEVPQGADYVISEVNGHWAAAFVEDFGKVAAGPGAPEEAPIDGGAPMDDAPIDPDAPEGPEGPSPEEDPGSDLGSKVDKIEKSIDKIIHALGIGDEHGGDTHDGPVEPPLPPEGLDGPSGPPAPPKPGKEPHPMPLKPGMSPPAFASVSKDHPWYEQISAKVASFEVEEEVASDEKIAGVIAELDPLVKDSGYKVAQVKDRTEGGRRIACVTIEAVSEDDPEA